MPYNRCASSTRSAVSPVRRSTLSSASTCSPGTRHRVEAPNALSNQQRVGVAPPGAVGQTGHADRIAHLLHWLHRCLFHVGFPAGETCGAPLIRIMRIAPQHGQQDGHCRESWKKAGTRSTLASSCPRLRLGGPVGSLRWRLRRPEPLLRRFWTTRTSRRRQTSWPTSSCWRLTSVDAHVPEPAYTHVQLVEAGDEDYADFLEACGLVLGPRGHPAGACCVRQERRDSIHRQGGLRGAAAGEQAAGAHAAAHCRTA